MKNRNIEHSDQWATPKWLYEQLDNEFHFDFDPCPLTEGGVIPSEKDGLLINWGKSNYINPPYNRKDKEAFIRKAVEESRKGKLCVMLLPVSTSTAIFHDVILPHKKEIRFLRGRVSFLGVNTKGEYTTTGKGMHDSMIVIFEGKNYETSEPL